MISGLCGLAWVGCDKWMVAVLLVVIMLGCPSTLCSYTLAPMDIAPNYAGGCSLQCGVLKELYAVIDDNYVLP